MAIRYYIVLYMVFRDRDTETHTHTQGQMRTFHLWLMDILCVIDTFYVSLRQHLGSQLFHVIEGDCAGPSTCLFLLHNSFLNLE